jgi:hypothetical protein
MIDDECAAVSRMRIGRGNQSTRRKPVPVMLCPPQVPHDLIRADRLSCGTAMHKFCCHIYWLIPKRLMTVFAHLTDIMLYIVYCSFVYTTFRELHLFQYLVICSCVAWNSLKWSHRVIRHIIIMWQVVRYVDYIVTCHLSSQPMQRSLLGNTSVTFSNTAGVASQPFPRNNGNIVGRCFLCCPCRGYITPFASCQRYIYIKDQPLLCQ